MRIGILLALSFFALEGVAMQKREKPKKDLCVFDTRWSGLTVGFQAGALINASDGAVRPSGGFLSDANIPNNPQRTDEFSMGGAGFTAGVQIGGNYQVKALVFGLETDINYSTLDPTRSHKRELTSPLSGEFADEVTQLWNWWGSLRPRIGAAIRPVLLYATGGLAYGHISSRTNVSLPLTGQGFSGARRKWRVGYAIGGGLEWAIREHWSVKAEYLFLDLSDSRYEDTPDNSASGGLAYKTKISNEGHVARIGFNYRV